MCKYKDPSSNPRTSHKAECSRTCLQAQCSCGELGGRDGNAPRGWSALAYRVVSNEEGPSEKNVGTLQMSSDSISSLQNANARAHTHRHLGTHMFMLFLMLFCFVKL